MELRSPRAKISRGGLGSPGFKAGNTPPGGGMNAQMAASGASPSPAAHGLVVAPLVTHASVGEPTLTYSRPVLSKANAFIRWTISETFEPSESVTLRDG